MPGKNHFDLHFLGAGHCRIEVVNLKPQEHPVSVGLEIRIADRAVMVPHVPSVQLKDQSIVQNKTLILGAAMCTSTTKQTLIPATARLDIVHANERLWAHYNFAVKFHKSPMASIRAATLPPILVVTDRWGIDDPNAFVGGLPPVRVVEKTCAIAKKYGHDVDFHFVDQTGLEVLLGDIGATAQGNVFAARSVPGPLKRCFDSVRDEMKSCPAFHLKRVAGMMR
jgi:hypothetical protein